MRKKKRVKKCSGLRDTVFEKKRHLSNDVSWFGFYLINFLIYDYSKTLFFYSLYLII